MCGGETGAAVRDEAIQALQLSRARGRRARRARSDGIVQGRCVITMF